MDFFEAQARAKKRTSRLVLLFVFAVVGIALGGYVAAVLGLHYGHGQPRRHRGYVEYEFDSARPVAFWQPALFAEVTLATIAVVGGASLFKWLSLRSGGSAVADLVGARLVDPHTTDLKERQLLNVVEEMAIASGVPVPPVYLLEKEPGLNAFAAGLTASDAVITVTRGTLDKLTRDELQGVVGHEFSHILNGDMRLNLKLTSILFGILVIGLLGRGLVRVLFYTPRRRSRGGKGGGGIFALFGIGVALMIIGYLGYFFGRLIQAAVSRQREFLADASAVQFTRNPAGISGALKKIGGYTLGGTIADHRATQISHFFFAQSFRSDFTGWFATHPTLDERLRAIDPSFDGKFFEPPEIVDIAHESFRDAGFAPPLRPAGAPARGNIAFHAATAAASIGQLDSGHVARAQDLLATIPPDLRRAAQFPTSAPALLYALLLANDSDLRTRQLATVARLAGEADSLQLSGLVASAATLPAEARLPLIQLALPALRQLDPAALDRLTATLDELVLADGRVSIFEYALQKTLLHHLAHAQKPTRVGDAIYSFEALAPPINVVLSALARAGAPDDSAAARAFAAGIRELRLIENRLALLPAADCSLVRLDAALDHLVTASLPIKKRLLNAACEVIGADGEAQIAEVELLRAICAVLDCPMPLAF